MESLLRTCWGGTFLRAYRTARSKPLHGLGFLIFTVFQFTNCFAQTATVNPPLGGFKIDGVLRANTPGSSAFGDWVPRLNSQNFSAGADSFVLNNAGTPKDPVTTRLKRDLYNSTSDSVFASGSKFNDYISALHWTQSGAPSKNDINNGLFHATGDAIGNQWVFIAGDRASVVGTSYIDFEFLQNTVTLNSDGTFSGGGPNGGRTAGDINISMQYDNGGSAPSVVIYRWKLSGSTYAWDSTGSSLITQAFAQTNLSTVDVPFGAFGSTTYPAFAFVEAAINITQLISQGGGANCGGLTIKTLWIKTKASSSSTAALKDFMTPISLNLNFGGVHIDQKGPVCVNGSNITLTATPAGGTFTASPVPGAITSGNIFNPSVAGVGTHRIVYTAQVGVGCTKSDTMFITVNALPTATISGTTAVCKGTTSPNITFTGSTGTAPYTFTYKINNGSNLTVTSGSGTNPVSVTVAVPTTTAGTFTYSLVSVQDASSTSCSQNQTGSATVTVNPLPTASISGNTAACKDEASPNVFFTGNGGKAPYTFTYKINNGPNQTVTSGSGANPVGITVAVPTDTPGSYTYSLVSVQDASSTSCSQAQTGSTLIVINPLPTATISGTTSVCKNGTQPSITFTGDGASAPYRFTYTINNGPNLTVTSGSGTNPVSVTVPVPTGTPGTYTYALISVTDSSTFCSQNQSGTATITVNDVPAAPTICIVQPSLCGPSTGSIKVISPLVAGDQYSKDNGQNWQNCNVFLGVAAGSNPIVRYRTATGCVSASATCSDATTCNPAPTDCPAGGGFGITKAVVPTTESTSGEATVKAYPNPFSDKINFVVTTPISGKGSLDVYDMMGQKVRTIYQGFISAGTQTFQMSSQRQQVANLIYVLRIGDKKISGRILQINQ